MQHTTYFSTIMKIIREIELFHIKNISNLIFQIVGSKLKLDDHGKA